MKENEKKEAGNGPDLVKTLEEEGQMISSKEQWRAKTELYLWNNEFYEVRHVKNQAKKAGKLRSTDQLDPYIEKELKMIALNNPPARIPVKCPFTGIVLIDDDGYHEPYPPTLVMENNDGEAVYHGKLSVMHELEEMIIRIQRGDSFLWSLTEKEIARLIRQLDKKFPQLDWDEVFMETYSELRYLVEEHSLVTWVKDENEYGSMAEGNYSYYFARPADQEAIQGEVQEILDYIKSFTEGVNS